jgi:hypothetical protein
MDRIKDEMEATESTGVVEIRIDEILATDEELVPSSGFLSAVMERVQEEASAPPPIPFPWKRALPGFALVAGVFGWLGVELVRAGVPAIEHGLPAAPQIPPGLVQPMEQAGWVGLALAVSLGSWLLARRLAGRAELL